MGCNNHFPPTNVVHCIFSIFITRRNFQDRYRNIKSLVSIRTIHGDITEFLLTFYSIILGYNSKSIWSQVIEPLIHVLCYFRCFLRFWLGPLNVCDLVGVFLLCLLSYTFYAVIFIILKSRVQLSHIINAVSSSTWRDGSPVARFLCPYGIWHAC